MELSELHKEFLSLTDVKFPSLPTTLIKVNQVLNNDWATDRELAAAITNPSLVVRLLQVANSPALGAQRKVETVENAAAMLGRVMVRNIVMCVSMRDMFSCTDKLLADRLKKSWQHNAEIAAIAVTLSKQFKVPRDAALVAGLLHDIGALPIIDYFERHSIQVDQLEATLTSECTPLGNTLLMKWEFPMSIVDATAASHQLPRDGGKTVFDLVSAAHYIQDNDESRLEKIGLTVDEFTELVQSESCQELLKSLT